MKIDYSKAFLKDLKKLPREVLTTIGTIVKEIEEAPNLQVLKNCKKLTGYENHYRIRMSDYRLVLLFIKIDNCIFIKRVLPRGEIYKKHNLPV